VLTAHDLSVIVVLHNSASSIVETVASIPSEVELVLVDNGSSDDGLARALSVRPDAMRVTAANRGFGAGCNHGVALAMRNVLMFLNPDAVILPGAIDRLLATLADNPDSIVGPKYLTAQGTLNANCRRRSTPWHEIAELLPSAERWLPRRLRRDVGTDDPIYRHGGSVPYVQGAAFVLRRETLEAAGGFDERYFLYSEEEDLAERVRKLGGVSILVSQAHVRHRGATSTSQQPLVSLRHLYRSRVLFYAARDGRVRAALFAAAAAIAATCRLMASGLRRRRGRERPNAAWWWAIVRGLAAGVRGAAASAHPPPS
jgi:N-acetylglucosaminyl-diphospho-decaprenol L-rhamnosyltransferase